MEYAHAPGDGGASGAGAALRWTGPRGVREVVVPEYLYPADHETEEARYEFTVTGAEDVALSVGGEPVIAPGASAPGALQHAGAAVLRRNDMYSLALEVRPPPPPPPLVLSGHAASLTPY